MRWSMMTLLLPLVFLGGCGREPAPPAGGGGATKAGVWLTSLDEALSQAKASKRPILVDFMAPW